MMLPPSAPNCFRGLLYGQNCPEDIGVVVKVKALFGNLREGGEAENPGVIDQNVQPFEGRSHFLE
jgi:hypothetical protein